MYSGFLIGILFGFILQRGQFCFVSGFRHLYSEKDNAKRFRFLTALFLAIFIQSVGFFSLAHFGLLTLPQSNLPLMATLVGGLCFGLGMALANCCGSGAWFRSGEGFVGCLLVLLVFALSLAASQAGFLKHLLNPLMENPLELDSIYRSLGFSAWWLVLIMGIIAFLLVREYCKSNLWILSSDKQAVFFRRVLQNRWSPIWTGLLLGLLSIVAWLCSAKTGQSDETREVL